MIFRLLCIGTLIYASLSTFARHRSFPLEETKEKESGYSESSMLMLSFYKPTFNALKYYNNFYKDTGVGLALHVGRYLYDVSFYSVGLGFAFTSYHDDGHQQKSASGSSVAQASDLTPVDADLALSLLSYQFFMLNSFQIPGFDYLSLNVLLGYEDLWFEEVRSIGTTTSTTTTASTTSSDKPIINSGGQSNFSINISMNILLNWLDETSVLALQKSQGFSKVYLSPYINITNKLANKTLIGNKKSNHISFANTAFGIAFLFETN